MKKIDLEMLAGYVSSKELRAKQYETFEKMEPSSLMNIDLMFVDGDHFAEGARIDLLNVIEHVSVGGLLVFDDIIHPLHMYLLDVWREVMKQYPDFKVLENTMHEYGWTVALRTY